MSTTHALSGGGGYASTYGAMVSLGNNILVVRTKNKWFIFDSEKIETTEKFPPDTTTTFIEYPAIAAVSTAYFPHCE